ncbi:MAG: gamma-glutamylcyclotransferase family protein [Pseudomonadota bacterium]
MIHTPLFCFGSLMDADVLRCVLDRKINDLSLEDATLGGYRVACLPHESYPLLVRQAGQMASGKLIHGLSEEDFARIVFFEGEEYQVSACHVSTQRSTRLPARFFDEGIMPPAESRQWSFERWQVNDKAYMLRQSAVYMSLYGKMSAAEADVYWQNYSEPQATLAS